MSNSSVHTSTALTSGSERGSFSIFDVLNFSTSSDEIYTALMSQVATENKQIEEKLQTLSRELAARNQDSRNGIESTDAATVEEFINGLLGFEDDPSISSMDKNALRSVIATLSQSLKNYNVEKWEQDCFSTDSNIIEKALIKLTNCEYDKTRTDEDRIATEDYLKVLSMAFSFLTQIRDKIAHSRLDNEANTAQAIEEYERVLKQIVARAEQYPHSAVVETADVVLALISRLKSSNLALSAIPFICFVIGLKAVISTKTVDTLCESLGIKDRLTLSTHAETALVLLCAIASLGSCARMIATATARTKLAATRQALLTVAEQCTRDPLLWRNSAHEVISALFSSGLITQAFITICTSAGLQNKDAEPAAMALTATVLILFGKALTECGAGTVSAMLNNLARKMQERGEDPFFFVRLAAEIGALAAREQETASTALLECAKKMLPDPVFSTDHLQEDSESMTQYMTDLMQLFANMVRGAGKLTIDLPQAG